MYTSFYNLERKPFEISTDPAFLWLGDKHREALSVLTYGIQYNKGLLLLTGDVGTGKTTLTKVLVQQIKKEVYQAVIADPGLEIMDFYNTLADKFKIKKRFTSKFAFIETFTRHLERAYELDRKVLLIIDEAQRMSPELMDEVRQLSNLEKDYNPLINIFFVGQMEFNDILVDPVNRALRQRITLNFHIETLDAAETGMYMAHRLKVAGSDEELFAKDAVMAVHELSGGCPRLINVLCDQALLSGYIKEVKTLDANIVRESAGQLGIDESFGGQPVDGGGGAGQVVEEEGAPAPAVAWRRSKSRSSLWVWLLVMVALMAVAGWMVYWEFVRAGT